MSEPTTQKVFFRHDDAEFFEHYELGKQIGVGGFATVMRGIDKNSNMPVAVKVVDKTQYSPADNSLEREVYILSELVHENIVRLICTYVCPSSVFIVTELAEGGELLERLSYEGSFSEADARLVVLQILRAIDYLHWKNVVHRDLKLENILLSSDSPPVVKVADFGLSRFFSDGSELRTICGSPLYVAPEILDIGVGADTYTPAVDMWSVGVILYILLSGYSPFDSDDEQASFQRIRKGEYTMEDTIWKYVSDDAKGFIHRLLTVDDKTRMTVTEALQHSWIVGAINTTTVPASQMFEKQSRYSERLEIFRLAQTEEQIAWEHAKGIDGVRL